MDRLLEGRCSPSCVPSKRVHPLWGHRQEYTVVGDPFISSILLLEGTGRALCYSEVNRSQGTESCPCLVKLHPLLKDAGERGISETYRKKHEGAPGRRGQGCQVLSAARLLGVKAQTDLGELPRGLSEQNSRAWAKLWEISAWQHTLCSACRSCLTRYFCPGHEGRTEPR